MRNSFSIAAVFAAYLVSAQGAAAADGVVPFTGVVTATCVLNVGTAGLLGINTSSNELSSTNSGGLAGSIAVTTTGTTYKISAIAPSAFTLSPDSPTTTFSTTYSASGATTASSTPGATTTTLHTGVTNVSVNLKAAKSSGVFTAGAYAAEVIVRCE